MTGVSGKKQERQDEDSADHRGARAFRVVHVHPCLEQRDRQEGDDDLADVVVEGAEELRPEKGRHARTPQGLTVTASRHSILHGRRYGPARQEVLSLA